MENCFGDSETLRVEDMPLTNFEAFICLIFATVKKDNKDCFYTIELVDDKKIINNHYRVPHFLFKRKENN